MNVLLMVLYATIVLGVLVFVHEGGHFLVARAFGVRVSEFMLGLPGPGVGIQRGRTRFGITCIPLGGYARICGMEPGDMSPHLQAAMASVYERGEALMEEVASDCGITDDEAYEALEELAEWGTVERPGKHDDFNMYRTPGFSPTRRQVRRALRKGLAAPETLVRGERRPLADPAGFFAAEYAQQYRSLPFWKRTCILLAGIGVNLLFALAAFIVAYSVLGLDVVDSSTGAVEHYTLDPLSAIRAGFMYIGMVVQAVVGLFNPATAAETVANSTSLVGIAVISKTYAEAGFAYFLTFMGMLSVSLGIMNLLPIPPLDGGRFVVEVYQRLRRRTVSPRAMGWLSYAGMALFLLLFVVMMNQDIQRFIFGNW